MSDLFIIPETLSPRLAWMKRHNIATRMGYQLNEWIAFAGDNIADFANGSTEDEAITNLAKLLNIPLWNEEGFKC